MDELDRIDVVDRLGLALEPVQGVVAGHGKQVMDAEPVKGIEDRFNLVSVLILAGKMDNGVDPEAADFGANYVRGQGRMAAGIVGDREGIDEPSPGSVLGKAQDLVLPLSTGAPAGDKLHRVNETVPPGEDIT